MFTLDEIIVENIFLDAEFDEVLFNEGFVARRERDDIWEVVLDQAGRVKATRTYITAEPQASSLTVHARSANVLVEHSEITTVMFQLEDVGELADFLAALDRIGRTEPQQPARAKHDDEDIWDDEDAF